MTDTFYGPWRLMTTPVAFGNTWAVRVHNSDNADGMYQADSAQPWDLDVHGAEWTVELVYLDGSGQWQPAPEMNRSTGIIAPNGLTVILQSHTPIRVDCVSLDPTINPPNASQPLRLHNPSRVTEYLGQRRIAKHRIEAHRRVRPPAAVNATSKVDAIEH